MLLAFIDDATSRLMHAAFVPSESTLDYLRETNAYITRHGRPIAFYSDKHAIFRVNRRDAAGGDGMTQFGRALHELNIDIICANSAPAKGRVERSFGTLQDRLVKEMRLAGISTLQAGNAFLPSFIEDHNRRFGKVPFDVSDAHRSLQAHHRLDDVFAWKEERTVSSNLTLQYDKVLFILEPNEVTRPLARRRVTVVDYPDGRLAICHAGLNLPYRTFDRLKRSTRPRLSRTSGLGPSWPTSPSGRRRSTSRAPSPRHGVGGRPNGTCSRSARNPGRSGTYLVEPSLPRRSNLDQLRRGRPSLWSA